jgi:hypothetical protein
MTKNLTAVMAVQRARALFCDLKFQARHRRDDKAFSRRRKLRFDVVMLLLLQKTIKSLQLHLHEFFERLSGSARHAVTPGAWSQARAKLRHTAFIELNQVAVLDSLYCAGQAAQLWAGHRLLAIDSSTLRLPDHAVLLAHFGGQQPSQQSGPCLRHVPHARLSVLYDVLNHIGLEARVGRFTQGEVALACQHLGALRRGDIVLADRGYAGYLLLAQIMDRGAHFIIRCSQQSFQAVQKLYEADQEGVSIGVSLPANTRAQEAKAMGLALELPVRLVSVRLASGELEVLATSLVDEKTYPTAEFLDLYHERWGIETWYKVLKGRLDLENFSGLSVEAILQDLHAAVFLCNLESVLTTEAAAQLPQSAEQGRRHGSKPNKAVTFHTLKSHVIDLLSGSQPVDEVLAQLTELFRANPVSIRPGRTPPRHPLLLARSLHFQKRIRKVVF